MIDDQCELSEKTVYLTVSLEPARRTLRDAPPPCEAAAANHPDAETGARTAECSNREFVEPYRAQRAQKENRGTLLLACSGAVLSEGKLLCKAVTLFLNQVAVALPKTLDSGIEGQDTH